MPKLITAILRISIISFLYNSISPNKISRFHSRNYLYRYSIRQSGFYRFLHKYLRTAYTILHQLHKSRIPMKLHRTFRYREHVFSPIQNNFSIRTISGTNKYGIQESKPLL